MLYESIHTDQRNIPALNRIGNPDDIIGTVLVENSEVCFVRLISFQVETDRHGADTSGYLSTHAGLPAGHFRRTHAANSWVGQEAAGYLSDYC